MTNSHFLSFVSSPGERNHLNCAAAVFSSALHPHLKQSCETAVFTRDREITRLEWQRSAAVTAALTSLVEIRLYAPNLAFQAEIRRRFQPEGLNPQPPPTLRTALKAPWGAYNAIHGAGDKTLCCTFKIKASE